MTDTATTRAGVLLPLPLAGIYDYVVPPDVAVSPGDIVRVPLGPRFVVGVVWGDGTGDVDTKKLKPIAERLDTPPMTEVQRRFVDWIASYTLSAPGAVLRMALSIPEALERVSTEIFYRLADRPSDIRVTPAREKVLALPAGQLWESAAAMARAAGVGAGVVRGLIDAGAVMPVAETGAWTLAPDGALGRVTLSTGQAAAASSLRAAVQDDRFSATLLEGVTGSGKTEVYFEAVAEALSKGRQCLVLLPEIALSAQWLDRFRRRFGSEPALWHSDIRRTQRRRVWRDIAEGRVQVVVGARSALLLPYPDLGLIIVDEEHDASYKQEDGVVYHARDMAVVRASLGGFPVVLAS
ncbi:MAG: DEAD/DEAH box helicase, partial [Pseudomonadota bacterium]